jgi:hypothetical protein
MTTSHAEPTDHEHHAGDGCEIVRHDDHVDHVHAGEHHREQAVHDGHSGAHSAEDGCQTLAHGDHVDHIHDGHRHFQHGDHVDEH